MNLFKKQAHFEADPIFWAREWIPTFDSWRVICSKYISKLQI